VAWRYDAPLREMRFVIERVLDAPASWARCAAFADLDLATAGAVLEEGARFASGVLLPLNASGDREGCTLRDGDVTMPAGFRDAYRALVDGGWPALACSAEWGGQGLPLLLDAALREMMAACNHGFMMAADVLHGAYETIKAHGSTELKSRYLAKVASGEWPAAMALTEPQAGSDLGALRTRALLQPDGSLRITGSKIFISGADHDLADNIVHLVLCRLQDASGSAPAGSKGLSLALVPKILPDGSRNAWVVDSLEHKLGLHASPTCALHYEGATGWLLGEPNRGLAAMFLMMNSARLHVGLQGLGHQEIATQNAVRHAFERVQLKAPIATTPAMRQLLLRLQAQTEGQRVIAYAAALAIDEAAHHEDPARRERQSRRAALLTPIIKALLTQTGFETASAALQVFGGYGYTREFGIEQCLRDVRITMVYEGTNEIQAIDLLQRKVLGDGGLALDELLADLEGEAARAGVLPDGQAFAAALRAQIAEARSTTAAIQAAAANDAEAPLRVADAYLQGLSFLMLTWAWAASARAIIGETDTAFAASKRARVRHGIDWLLPEAAAHWAQARATDTPLAKLDPTH